MSLINDALRRAKAAQQRAPVRSAQNLEFRPVEAPQQVRPGRGRVVPAVVAVCALLALFFVWQRSQKHESTGPQEVRALTPAAVHATATPQPALGDVTPAVPVLVAQSKPAPETATGPAPVSNAVPPPVPETIPAPAGPTAANPPESQATNPAALTLSPPKPAPLRLQAILFNPKRPSAIVSGKTLFIGDRLGALRLVAIDQESATLVGTDQTNVLTLSK